MSYDKTLQLIEERMAFYAAAATALRRIAAWESGAQPTRPTGKRGRGAPKGISRSPETRQRMSAAAKARWAARKNGEAVPAQEEPSTVQ